MGTSGIFVIDNERVGLFYNKDETINDPVTQI